MGLLNWIMGDEQKGLIDKVAGGIDSLVFTDQEKSGMFLDYLRATGGQNMARRIGAVMIWALWTFLILLMVFLHLVGWTVDANFVKDTLVELVATPFALVTGFYYAAHLVRGSRWGSK